MLCIFLTAVWDVLEGGIRDEEENAAAADGLVSSLVSVVKSLPTASCAELEFYADMLRTTVRLAASNLPVAAKGHRVFITHLTTVFEKNCSEFACDGRSRHLSLRV